MTTAMCSPACATGETCVAGVCQCGIHPTCGGTMACCGGSCVDTTSSIGNCGACGFTCSSGSSCCSSMCINTTSNIDNCGACGRACDAMTADRCVSSACMCRTVPACNFACYPFGTPCPFG